MKDKYNPDAGYTEDEIKKRLESEIAHLWDWEMHAKIEEYGIKSGKKIREEIIPDAIERMKGEQDNLR